ncbi:hypothetical protein AB0G02_18400 [Actinosynnema sp. NPDC023658]|uniref:hypothetical protein n=1 Tax=Actinosynnema sp. NPDC023658 TaxID=3155465 RepID=UPI00340DDF5A
MRKCTRVAAVLLALGTAAAGTAVPAAAAPLGLQLVTRTSPVDQATKEVVVGCPGGTKAYSVGARVNGSPPGFVVVDRVEPAADLTSVVVRARPRVVGTAWSVTGFALCGFGQPRLYPSGDTVQADQVLHDTDTDAESCPAGQVTGVGATISNPANEPVGLYALKPNPALSAAIASASGPAGPWPAGQWKVKAWAICAELSLDLALVEAMSGKSEDSPKTVIATCPDGSLIGWGGAVDGPPPHKPAALEGTTPNTTDNEVTAIGTAGASPWSMAAYAICVK